MSVHDDAVMAPEASPGGSQQKAGVRRVNNLPLYIVGGVLIGFLLMMIYVATERARKQHHADTEEQKKGGNSTVFAKEITGKYDTGFIPAEPPAIPPELSSTPAREARPELVVPIARPDLKNPPAPPRPERTQKDEDLDRFRQIKMQLFEEAVKSKTTVPVGDHRAKAAMSAPAGNDREATLQRMADVRNRIAQMQSEDPAAAYKARLAVLREQGQGTPDGADDPYAPPKLLPPPPENPPRRDELAQFEGQGTKDRWRLDSQPEVPRTPYELRAGFVIPATMISGVNSDLAGQIMAQVSSNVYDTPRGKHLLVPQGSRLVGTYSHEVAYGQERVLVAWQRIVFPDGKAMDIGAMPGTDSAGYAGFQDQVNHHYLRIFGSAFMMSLITAGITYSQNRNNSMNYGYQQSASGTLSAALGQQLGQATAAMLMKNLNVAPSLEIRPGYRFNVMVNKDMTFSKPYRSFDYSTAGR
jgi:type IV secretory pathway VirB10-like protein